MHDDLIHKNASKLDLIKQICSRKHVRELLFIIWNPFNLNERIQGYYIATNVLRKDLNLDPDGKPGDIDILILPKSKKGILHNRIAAVEVKVVRPTIEKPHRGANTDGVSQTLGLAQDGFPLVGLLHLVLSEPVPADQKIALPFYPDATNPDVIKSPGDIFGREEKAIIDPFVFNSISRQIGRLNNLNLPRWVGKEAVGINFINENQTTSSYSMDNESEQLTDYNPQTSQEVIINVLRFFSENTDRVTYHPMYSSNKED